jgi:hypothetical protein
MTADRIRGVRLKIERAKEHVRDLDAAIGDFLRDEPYRLGAKPHPVVEINHTTLYVAEVKPAPGRLSLLMGDAIHNLRSALDHLAWQLVEAGGGRPDRNTYFPICDTAQQYASAIGKGEIQKITPEARDIIQSVQPYVTVEQTLWLIQHLDIVDKHRLLLTVVSAMNRWGVDLARGARVWFHEDRFVPLVVGEEITNLPTSTYETQQHEVYKLGLEVAFAESEIPEGELVLYTLNQMVTFVDGLVSGFEPFLA